MSEVDDFIRQHTFYCETLKAKISQEQCKANRVRAFVKEMKPLRPSFVTAPEDAENIFFKNENDNSISKCCECPMYNGASQEEVQKYSSSTTLRRYPDTEAGAAERKLLCYQYDHQEKLYDEENRYLSRTSPKQRKVARLHIVIT